MDDHTLFNKLVRPVQPSSLLQSTMQYSDRSREMYLGVNKYCGFVALIVSYCVFQVEEQSYILNSSWVAFETFPVECSCRVRGLYI